MKKYSILFFLLLVLAVKAFSSTGEKEVRLLLMDSVSRLADETNLYFDVGVSPAYLPGEDTKKVYDTVMVVPQIYSLTSDGVPCTSNLYGPFNISEVIGLGLRIGMPGIYILSADQIQGFDPTSIILLEDRATGALQDMRVGSYVVELDPSQNNAGRFFLHVSHPPAIGIVPAGCTDNGGAISVNQDSSVLWSSIQLFDSSNVYIGSYNNVKGDFNFTGLQEGNYNLAFVYGVYSAVKPVFINGSQIICNIGASTTNATVGEEVDFHSNARNATGYAWNFGDSTLVDGVANIDYAFYEPGHYNVSVQCTNHAGCSAYAYITIIVTTAATPVSGVAPDQTKIYTEHKNLIIKTSNESYHNYEVFDISGKMILKGPLTINTLVQNMPDEASGMYIVRLKSTEGDLTRKIFLE